MTFEAGRGSKVLHITFNMDFGGTEQVISQLVANLDPKRFRNTILCIDGRTGPMGEKLRSQGYDVMSFSRKPGLDFDLIRKVRSLVKREEIDIIHCHQYTPFTYGWFAHWGTSAKLVFTEHGRFHPDRYRYKAIGLNPIMAMSTGRVVAISNATKKALQQFEFFPPYKVGVIYNGIRPLQLDQHSKEELGKALGLVPGQPVIGTVARFDAVKNQAMMIKSFKSVLNNVPDCKLLLVGDGPERARLESLATELGVRDRVIFTGFVQQPHHHMALMNVFLLPSFTEGTSMTLLEAMSLGIPSVVTSVGGNPEIVSHGKTGLVCGSGDEAALTEAVVRLLNNSALRNKFSENASQEFARRFVVERMIDSYSSLYRTLLDDRRR